jgi:hypothetical protein
MADSCKRLCSITDQLVDARLHSVERERRVTHLVRPGLRHANGDARHADAIGGIRQLPQRAADETHDE